ncbi:serine/threonine-protein kinase VRK1-like [Mya arenaria]|uniref:serine/threonine-protein kinase VRK1-like n=1 Tax=Mya arenaria TaxID=6604 RepID=UPI0022E77E64|nr:serine/threonine-protein kinase VRK1-like [Mya arenaria]XP_052766358.1 serine/threonine-protein kinase VRK1-like [Mya arenaria]XP_052766359.1 serine/threonine-protein kinase VRK1-like [Mya arenaria]
MPRAKNVVAAAKKPRKPKGHVLAEKFPNGEILRDLCKKEWRLGDVIGQGGFGLIYMAAEKESGKVGQDAGYVVKIEPMGNGPLFCELHFYQRVAKPDLIESWVKSHKVKYLGIPKFIASGQHVYKGTNYRFMVMQRFSTDLQMIFEASGKHFSRQTVCALALRLIDAMQFLHENNYVHADMKAANCLLGYKAGKVEADVVYLVDYGLAYKYAPEGNHKAYKEDPKKAHDGTIEFTSRDAHKGVDPSRRADMEILGYCLLQWLCGRLPWEDKLSDCNYVSDSKHKYMNDIPGLMKKCFPQGSIPDEIKTYFNMVKNLSYDEQPNYTKMREVFTKGLSSIGVKDVWKLALPIAGARTATPLASPKKGVKRKQADADVKVKSRAASPRPSTPKKTKPMTPKPGSAATKPMSPKPAARKPAAAKGKPSPAKATAGRATPTGAAKKMAAKKLTPTAAAAIARAAGAKAAQGSIGSPLQARSRVQSPKGQQSPRALKTSAATKRAKSPAAGSPVPKKRKVTRKKNVVMNEMAIQTSPGLKKNR